MKYFNQYIIAGTGVLAVGEFSSSSTKGYAIVIFSNKSVKLKTLQKFIMIRMKRFLQLAQDLFNFCSKIKPKPKIDQSNLVKLEAEKLGNKREKIKNLNVKLKYKKSCLMISKHLKSAAKQQINKSRPEFKTLSGVRNENENTNVTQSQREQILYRRQSCEWDSACQ